MNCDRGAALNGKTPARIKKRGGPMGTNKTGLVEGGGPTGKGLLLIGIVIEVCFRDADYRVILPPA